MLRTFLATCSSLIAMIHSTPRMIEMYGDTSQPGVPYGSDYNGCLAWCLNDYFCGLIKWTLATGICETFQWNSSVIVTRKTSLDGVIVAWKRDLTSCPVSRDPPLFGNESAVESTSTSLAYSSYTISLVPGTTSSWTFIYQSSFICPSDTKMFVRADKEVCLTIRPFGQGQCLNQSGAQSICKLGNGAGITAMNSPEEAEYFKTLGNQLLLTYSLPSTTQKSIWLDGLGSSGNFTHSDDTLTSPYYPWTSGTPFYASNGSCLYYRIGSVTASLNGTKSCWESRVGTAYCYFGTACRVNPEVNF